MYLDWKVGDRVQCVDNGGAIGRWWNDAPVVGKIYTIRSIHLDHRGDVTVWLNEIQRDPRAIQEHGPLVGYYPRRFRKVQPRKTSIAIFEAMLHGNRSEVDA